MMRTQQISCVFVLLYIYKLQIYITHKMTSYKRFLKMVCLEVLLTSLEINCSQILCHVLKLPPTYCGLSVHQSHAKLSNCNDDSRIN